MPSHPRIAAHLEAIPASVYSSLAGKLASFAGESYPLHVGDTWMEPAEGCRMEDAASGEGHFDFTFDAAGQMSGAENVGSSSLDMTYDGRGFLSQAADPPGTAWVRSTYDGSGTLRSLERRESLFSLPERINVLYFAGQPIALWKKAGGAASTLTFLVTDHLGTPIASLPGSGSGLDWSGGFEPFGRDWQEGTKQSASSHGIPLRLPGQWTDPLWTKPMLGAEHYYNVNRWFDRSSGRYASVDPVAWYTKDQMVYLYSQSSPMRFRDPLGLVVVPCEGCEELWDYYTGALDILADLRSGNREVLDPDESGDYRVLARTGCARPVSRTEEPIPFTDWPGPYPFATNPCIHSCVGAHERTHRKQCRTLGVERWDQMVGDPEQKAKLEVPAYEESLKCIESAIRNGFLDIGLGGVSY